MTASRLAIASFIGLAVLSPLGCGENDDSGARPDESAGSGGSEAGAGGEAGSAGEGNQGGAAGASGNGGLGGSSGKSCGNGTLDSGETCDPGIKTGQGKCPSSCNDGNACTVDSLVGKAADCTAKCTTKAVTQCGPDDGCCPVGCNSETDWDCKAVCGNGVSESGEMCDSAIAEGQPGHCPTSCDDGQACTKDALVGSAASCSAHCELTTITQCVGGDGCCPAGCSHALDADCSATCGNGSLDPGETCDKAITGGPGSCVSACDDGNACTLNHLIGSADNCSAACSTSLITQCGATDGCCPKYCTSSTDSDCSAACGNGVVDQGETCDKTIVSGPGKCPTSCNDGQSCTIDVLIGDKASCSASCVSTVITQCAGGDGCCPTGCSANTDTDCSVTCGNGEVEPGERCDKAIPTGSGSCPTACDDGQSCTIDELVGSAGTCSAYCAVWPITQCKSNDACCPAGCNKNTDADCSATCGNGVKEAGETCDKAIPSGAGSCPTACDDNDACTVDFSGGTVDQCSIWCSHDDVTQCLSGDGCCPWYCSAPADTDCSCKPKTCAYVGGTPCGTMDNGCGTIVDMPCCTASSTCTNNVCTCVSGTHACGSQCAADTSVLACGTGCSPCFDDPHGTPTCDGVSCGVECDDGYHGFPGGKCGAWVTAPITYSAGGTDYGFYSAIAAGSDGNARIVFQDPIDDSTARAVYGLHDGAIWSFEEVSNQALLPAHPKAGLFADIAVQGTTPHLAYVSTGTVGASSLSAVTYAVRKTSTWTTETVKTASSTSNEAYVSRSRIAVSNFGNPWVLYQHRRYDQGAASQVVDTVVAHRDGTSWVHETVASIAGYTDLWLALAVDSSGQPHVAHGTAPVALRYSVRGASGTWKTLDIPGVLDYSNVSLSLDSAGLARIAYQRSGGAIAFAWLDGSAVWHLETAVAASAASPALSLDDQQRAHIAFGNVAQGEALWYSVRTAAGVWRTERAETDVSGPNAHAVDLVVSGQNPHVLYSTLNSSKLRYAISAP